jgi:hypothetical protein
MAYYNAPPSPDAPQHSNPLKPWLLPVLAAFVVLAFVAWNVDSSGQLPVTVAPNITSGLLPSSN